MHVTKHRPARALAPRPSSMGKIPKKKSKRILLKDKNKIARKVRQHHKKQRREAKKNPNKFKHKDPGIPNSWPFKQELLAEQEQARTDEREMHARARAHKEVLKQRAANQKDARLQRSRPSAKQLRDESVSSALAAAHALVLVLDARDPPAGRCARLEQLFTESADADAAPRALVVALNHAHLVPADNLAGWLLALQRDGVCAVPYCAVADEAALAKSGKGTSRQIALKAAGATELCDLLARIAAEPALAAARADKAGGKAAKAAAAVAPLKVVVAGAPGSGVADVRATLALRLKKKGPARGLVEVVETFVSLEPRLAADGCNLPHANPTAGVLSFGLRPSRKATDLVQLAGVRAAGRAPLAVPAAARARRRRSRGRSRGRLAVARHRAAQLTRSAHALRPSTRPPLAHPAPARRSSSAAPTSRRSRATTRCPSLKAPPTFCASSRPRCSCQTRTAPTRPTRRWLRSPSSSNGGWAACPSARSCPSRRPARRAPRASRAASRPRPRRRRLRRARWSPSRAQSTRQR